MRGLDTFREFFKGFTDSYVVIGGAACDDYFEREGIPFRVTDDIDMILVVEAVDDEFIARFWAATLSGEDQLDLPGSIQKDMEVFIGIMEADPPQTREILPASEQHIQTLE